MTKRPLSSNFFFILMIFAGNITHKNLYYAGLSGRRVYYYGLRIRVKADD